MIIKIRFAFTLFILFLLYSCANIVAPKGGPKDETPPKIIRSTPPNFSANYNGEEVRVYFDEFVELESLQENLLISPPVKNQPEIRVRGRSIIMTIEDTLRPNTTYNFFFGDAIVDITEGNPIENFQIILSTGDYVDSLAMMGRLVNAQNLLPEEDAFVMLYDSVYDSVPMLERPVYVSKTNEKGEFFIRNMRDTSFLMFALRDMNANYLYDTPEESIAFIDSLVKPEFIPALHHIQPKSAKDTLNNDTINNPQNETNLPQSVPDTTNPAELNDTLKNDQELPEIASGDTLPADTLANDTLSTQPEIKSLSYTLFMFTEKDTLQRVVSSNLVSKGKISLLLRIPADTIQLREIREPLDPDDILTEYNPTRDSLTLWVPDIERDSLFLEITDRNTIIDTVDISLVPRTNPNQQEETEEETFINISRVMGVPRNKHPYHQPIQLQSTTPLQSIITDSWEFFINDSIPIETNYTLMDPLHKRIQLTIDPEPDTTYRLFIPPGTITDIFSNTNDTLEFRFSSSSPEDYGSIFVNLQLPELNQQNPADTVEKSNSEYFQDPLHSINDNDTLPTDQSSTGKSRPDTLSTLQDTISYIQNDTLQINILDKVPITDSIAKQEKDTLLTPDQNIIRDHGKENTQHFILQLLDTEWNIINELPVNNDDVYIFEYLQAKKFKLRLVADKNKNGKWDTGDYLQQVQPEPVFIYPEDIESRLNWEVEVIWNINED